MEEFDQCLPSPQENRVLKEKLSLFLKELLRIKNNSNKPGSIFPPDSVQWEFVLARAESLCEYPNKNQFLFKEIKKFVQDIKAKWSKFSVIQNALKPLDIELTSIESSRQKNTDTEKNSAKEEHTILDLCESLKNIAETQPDINTLQYLKEIKEIAHNKYFDTDDIDFFENLSKEMAEFPSITNNCDSLINNINIANLIDGKLWITDNIKEQIENFIPDVIEVDDLSFQKNSWLKKNLFEQLDLAKSYLSENSADKNEIDFSELEKKCTAYIDRLSKLQPHQGMFDTYFNILLQNIKQNEWPTPFNATFSAAGTVIKNSFKKIPQTTTETRKDHSYHPSGIVQLFSPQPFLPAPKKKPLQDFSSLVNNFLKSLESNENFDSSFLALYQQQIQRILFKLNKQKLPSKNLMIIFDGILKELSKENEAYKQCQEIITGYANVIKNRIQIEEFKTLENNNVTLKKT